MQLSVFQLPDAYMTEGSVVVKCGMDDVFDLLLKGQKGLL